MTTDKLSDLKDKVSQRRDYQKFPPPALDDPNKNIESGNTNSTNTETVRNNKSVPLDTLVRLNKAGFKLIPLQTDSKRANVYDGLITEAEFKRFPSAEGKPVRIIHENPSFWSEARLQNKAHLFHNVATTCGLTNLKDSKERPLYLYGVDVDTKEAYEALSELIDTLKGVTYIVKTHKEYGYHFYILTPVYHEAIGRTNFRQGAEIEVKTDMSLGTMHLPPSRHRKYPYWNYQHMSTAEIIYIDEEDKVFQEILKAMSPFFRKEPTEESILNLAHRSYNQLCYSVIHYVVYNTILYINQLIWKVI